MPPQREWFEKDYYKILGVSESATQKEITKAYRKLAGESHPDKHPGDAAAEDRFKEASAAYDVVGDEAKRTEYDEVVAWARWAAWEAAGRPGGFGSTAATRRPRRPVRRSVQPGRRSRGVARRRRHRASARRRPRGRAAPSFEDAVHGVTTAVHLTSEAACSRCDGSGAEPGTTPTVVPDLRRPGRARRQPGLLLVLPAVPHVPGPRRRASRTRARTAVAPASSTGRARSRSGSGRGQRRAEDPAQGSRRPGPQRRAARRPARHGARRRARALRPEGRRSHHQRARHLRRGRPGAEILVPTLGGEPVKIRVPAGTRSGKVFRLCGRGVPWAKTGSLLVTIEVAVPAKLSTEERKAIETLASVSDESPRAHLGV